MTIHTARNEKPIFFSERFWGFISYRYSALYLCGEIDLSKDDYKDDIRRLLISTKKLRRLRIAQGLSDYIIVAAYIFSGEGCLDTSNKIRFFKNIFNDVRPFFRVFFMPIVFNPKGEILAKCAAQNGMEFVYDDIEKLYDLAQAQIIRMISEEDSQNNPGD